MYKKKKVLIKAVTVSLRSCLTRHEILPAVTMIVLYNADLRINAKIIAPKLVKRNVFPKKKVAHFSIKKCRKIGAVLRKRCLTHPTALKIIKQEFVSSEARICIL